MATPGNPTGIRFCRTPHMQLAIAEQNLCRWPTKDIPWTVTALLPGVTESQAINLFASVYDHIAQHCGITPRMVSQARTARILSGVRRIDGSGGVLAESELPCGNPTTCRQWYDVGEAWDWGTHWNGQRQSIWFWMVALHEILHALGIGHCEDRGVVAVLNPTYNPNLKGLQPWDIQQLQLRYGKPTAVVPTPLPPVNPIPVPNPPTPIPPGGFMGNAIALLNLFTQIKPLLDFFLANQESLGNLLAVIKKLADLFNRPTSVQRMVLGLERSQLEDLLAKFSAFLASIARATPTPVDDALAQIVANAISTPWLLDFFYQLATGQAAISPAMVELAMAQVQADSVAVTPTV